jgi:hypothetical protein
MLSPFVSGRAAPASAEARLSRPERCAWLLLIIATWMLFHLYGGLRHDGIMYTMQGLAHVHPQLWANDVYLRFGSQDQYTIFASIYARLIEWFGLEHGAALFTAVGELAFFVTAWRLARLLVAERAALIALFLLIALPGTYGNGIIFHVVEDFVTPRLMAEALALATVLNWLQGRRLLACLCAAAGLLLHPIMSVAGVAVGFWVSLVLPRPRLAGMLGLLCLAGLLLVRVFASGPPLRFDDFWFFVSPAQLDYLLISHWDIYAWGVAVVPLIILAAGSALIESQPARQLAQAGLGVGITGLALSSVGGDLLHLALIIQGQPWRCLWLSTVIAVLLLPLITQRLWQHNDLSRGALLILLAEYLLIGETYSVHLAVVALALLGLSLRFGVRVPAAYQRLALWGAALVLALALGVLFTDRLLPSHFNSFPHQQIVAPLWAKRILAVSEGGFVPIVLVLLIAWALRQPAARYLAPALAVASAAACCILAPVTWSAWSQVAYQPADSALFESWRAKIPPGTEVLFPENPLLVWILLERPSYLSGSQGTSALFSRPAAMFMYGRVEALRPYLRAVGQSFWDPVKGAHPTSEPTLALACATGDLQFVILRNALDVTPVAEVSPTAKPVYRGLKLYQCPNAPI